MAQTTGRTEETAGPAVAGAAAGQMRWASAISERVVIDEAIRDAALRVREGLGAAPDLACVFVSSHFANEYEAVGPLLHKYLGPRALVGTSGAGVIGDGREAEHRPAVSIIGGLLPGAEARTFHLPPGEIADLDVSESKWRKRLAIPSGSSPDFILFANPFDCPADELIEALDQAFPGSKKVGGLASGTNDPTSICMFEDRGVHRSGAVGVILTGDVEVDTIVAQGCRPIGAPGKVTKAAGTLLAEIDGRPSLQNLMELVESLPPDEQRLVRTSLHCGISLESRSHEGEDYRGADFLIRNVMGIDRERGALQIGHVLREGVTVQWHVRDAQTAREELERMIQEYSKARSPGSSGDHSPAGVFLFSCTGRGAHFFGIEGHDSGIVRDRMGKVPMGGFFCNGEIGPVGEVTYLHGFTSSIAVVRPKRTG
ncbi:MAG TPA: FIST N-terminal domain-containing protein [Thermoplasmata archaeon]|nr:FIST N-terminal domain-containing protein [Thermoplasmata archaeon]